LLVGVGRFTIYKERQLRDRLILGEKNGEENEKYLGKPNFLRNSLVCGFGAGFDFWCMRLISAIDRWVLRVYGRVYTLETGFLELMVINNYPDIRLALMV
jgi:hypothetical protein